MSKHILTGIPASPGIVMGQVSIYNKKGITINKNYILPDKVDDEIKKFKDSLNKTKNQLNFIKEKFSNKDSYVNYPIIDFNIIQDHDILNEVEKLIREKLLNAQWAVYLTIKEMETFINNVDDIYLKERLNDIKMVSDRIVSNLSDSGDKDIPVKIDNPCICLSHDLSPADTALISRFSIKGFVTEVGSKISHTAILSRSLEIPAVVGVSNITGIVEPDDFIIVDGNQGMVIINPDEKEKENYEKLASSWINYEKSFYNDRYLPAETMDNFKINVFANIDLPSEVDLAYEYGAEGIGLYRTEFLFYNRESLPDEDEQFQLYSNVIDKFGSKPVIFRTFDIGEDILSDKIKCPGPLKCSNNLRALRLSLRYPDIFITQIKAILRASVYGNVKIMFPFIGGLSDLNQGLELVEKAKEILFYEKYPFNEDIEIGCMIELPAAVIISDILAEKVDFFSIGTNDLIQYTLAIERMNENLDYLYNPLDISILRSIKKVVDVANEKNIEVSLCGAMSDDPLYSFVLLGMGLKNLSMSFVSIPKIKAIIRGSKMSCSQKLVSEVLSLKHTKDIEELVVREMKIAFPHMFNQQNTDRIIK